MTQFMSNSIFFGAAISLIAYEAGLLLKRKFRMAIFNPLLIAIIAVMAVLSLLHIDYDTYNQSGQYISYLLTPATVCLAVPLYQQMELLKKNHSCGYHHHRCSGKYDRRNRDQTGTYRRTDRQRTGTGNFRPCHWYSQGYGTR